MDIFIPIGIGFVVNVIIFFIILLIFKNKSRAIGSTFISTAVLIVASYIIGRWIGMGLFVISMGMLAAALVILISSSLLKAKKAIS